MTYKTHLQDTEQHSYTATEAITHADPCIRTKHAVTKMSDITVVHDEALAVLEIVYKHYCSEQCAAVLRTDLSLVSTLHIPMQCLYQAANRPHYTYWTAPVH